MPVKILTGSRYVCKVCGSSTDTTGDTPSGWYEVKVVRNGKTEFEDFCCCDGCYVAAQKFFSVTGEEKTGRRVE